MQAGSRSFKSLIAAGVIAVAAAPVALAAPGGIPGKPAGTPGGKPAGTGKPEGTPSGHGKPTGTGKPEGTPGGGPPAGPETPTTAGTEASIGGDGGSTSAHGAGKGSGRPVAYVFKGVYEGPGLVEGHGSVAVTHGNKRGRAFDDQTVEFDLSAAELSVADTTGDGEITLADVADGDLVVVKAKLPKSDPGAQPFAAKQLVDETNPAPEDPEDPEGV